MNLTELFLKVNSLTGKFPQLTREEIEELKRLSIMLSKECDNALYDWDK